MNSTSFKGHCVIDSKLQRSNIFHQGKVNFSKFVKLNKDFAVLTPKSDMTLKMTGLTEDKAQFCLINKEKKVVSEGTFVFDATKIFSNLKSLVDIFNSLQDRAITIENKYKGITNRKEAIINLLKNQKTIGINQAELQTLLAELEEINNIYK